MMLNKAFQTAAGLIKPDPPPKTDKQLAREAKTPKQETWFDADVSHMNPRDAARKMARSITCKNASIDGNRLPFAERAKYLQAIIEKAQRKDAERNSVIRAKNA